MSERHRQFQLVSKRPNMSVAGAFGVAPDLSTGCHNQKYEQAPHSGISFVGTDKPQQHRGDKADEKRVDGARVRGVETDLRAARQAFHRRSKDLLIL
jgi:hypothetical protein